GSGGRGAVRPRPPRERRGRRGGRWVGGDRPATPAGVHLGLDARPGRPAGRYPRRHHAAPGGRRDPRRAAPPRPARRQAGRASPARVGVLPRPAGGPGPGRGSRPGPERVTTSGLARRCRPGRHGGGDGYPVRICQEGAHDGRGKHASRCRPSPPLPATPRPMVMPDLYLTYLSRPDVEAAALADEEIIAAIESGLAMQGRGETVIEPRVHLEPKSGAEG